METIIDEDYLNDSYFNTSNPQSDNISSLIFLNQTTPKQAGQGHQVDQEHQAGQEPIPASLQNKSPNDLILEEAFLNGKEVVPFGSKITIVGSEEYKNYIKLGKKISQENQKILETAMSDIERYRIRAGGRNLILYDLNGYLSKKYEDRLKKNKTNVKNCRENKKKKPEQNISSLVFQNPKPSNQAGQEPIVSLQQKYSSNDVILEEDFRNEQNIPRSEEVNGSRSRTFNDLSLTDDQLKQSEWLTDIEINAYLKLLRTQFPDIKGLDDPVVSKNLNIDDGKEDYVQVVLSRNNHWICLKAKFDREIFLYDSLDRTEVDDPLKVAIEKMYTPNGFIFIVFKRVQKQQKQLCGYFALAFATALCFQKNPEYMIFKEDLLIEHYINCIRENQAQEFPHFIIDDQNESSFDSKFAHGQ